MQKNDGRPIGGAGFGVTDIQDAGIDLLQRSERRVRSRLDRRQLCRCCGACLCACGARCSKLRGRDDDCCSADEPASTMFDFSNISVVSMAQVLCLSKRALGGRCARALRPVS